MAPVPGSATFSPERPLKVQTDQGPVRWMSEEEFQAAYGVPWSPEGQTPEGRHRLSLAHRREQERLARQAEPAGPEEPADEALGPFPVDVPEWAAFREAMEPAEQEAWEAAVASGPLNVLPDGRVQLLSSETAMACALPDGSDGSALPELEGAGLLEPVASGWMVAPSTALSERSVAACLARTADEAARSLSESFPDRPLDPSRAPEGWAGGAPDPWGRSDRQRTMAALLASCRGKSSAGHAFIRIDLAEAAVALGCTADEALSRVRALMKERALSPVTQRGHGTPTLLVEELLAPQEPDAPVELTWPKGGREAVGVPDQIMPAAWRRAVADAASMDAPDRRVLSFLLERAPFRLWSGVPAVQAANDAALAAAAGDADELARCRKRLRAAGVLGRAISKERGKGLALLMPAHQATEAELERLRVWAATGDVEAALAAAPPKAEEPKAGPAPEAEAQPAPKAVPGDAFKIPLPDWAPESWPPILAAMEEHCPGQARTVRALAAAASPVVWVPGAGPVVSENRKEAAALLEASPDAFKSRVHRARDGGFVKAADGRLLLLPGSPLKESDRERFQAALESAGDGRPGTGAPKGLPFDRWPFEWQRDWRAMRDDTVSKRALKTVVELGELSVEPDGSVVSSIARGELAEALGTDLKKANNAVTTLKVQGFATPVQRTGTAKRRAPLPLQVFCRTALSQASLEALCRHCGCPVPDIAPEEPEHDPWLDGPEKKAPQRAPEPKGARPVREPRNPKKAAKAAAPVAAPAPRPVSEPKPAPAPEPAPAQTPAPVTTTQKGAAVPHTQNTRSAAGIPAFDGASLEARAWAARADALSEAGDDRSRAKAESLMLTAVEAGDRPAMERLRSELAAHPRYYRANPAYREATAPGVTVGELRCRARFEEPYAALLAAAALTVAEEEGASPLR